MPQDPPDLLLSEPDAAVLEKLALLERAGLAIAAATVLVSTTEWFLPGLSEAFPPAWGPLSGEGWCATVLCGIAIYFAHPRFSVWAHRLSILLGALVALGSASTLAYGFASVLTGPEVPFLQLHLSALMTQQASVGFLALGVAIVFLQAERYLTIAADVLSWVMGVVVLTLISAQFLGAFPFFGPVVPARTSHQTMICLSVLGCAALGRRARSGAFRVFLGRSTGSRVARILAPILIILPFVREGIRARMFRMHRMPSLYITAFLAAMAVGISYLLVLYLAWRINGLEEEVHQLSLRDPLTDLYNLRGFRLLAEQALRMARRSGEPFSLLFIDVDGLKQINDELGHQTGSEFLVEIAEIMQETFRDSDVLGRIGGDEFAVAGEFSEDAILQASDRLQEAATRRNASSSREFPLSFSIGHVTSKPGNRESLTEMLASADEAMYQVKRRRKAVLR